MLSLTKRFGSKQKSNKQKKSLSIQKKSNSLNVNMESVTNTKGASVAHAALSAPTQSWEKVAAKTHLCQDEPYLYQWGEQPAIEPSEPIVV